jgi:capsular polysaccharide biosynthesis protein
VIGLILGVVMMFVAEYLDQTIHHPDDLKKLGIQSLGQIPRHKE